MTRQVTLVPIKDIRADDAWNCRGRFEPDSVGSLADQIGRDGLDTPITIRPDPTGENEYHLVTGHRRLAAVLMLGWDEIPAFVRTDLDEEGAKRVNLVENIQRQNLSMDREAESLRWFTDQDYPAAKIATLLGQSRGWVDVRLRLLDLPDAGRDAVRKGEAKGQDVGVLWKVRNDPAKFAEALARARAEYAMKPAARKVKPRDVSTIVAVRRPTIPELAEYRAFAVPHIQGTGGEARMWDYEPAVKNLLGWMIEGRSLVQMYADIYRAGRDVPADVKELFDSSKRGK